MVLFYLWLVTEKGNSPRMAEMLALRQTPRIMTDDVAMAGAMTIGKMYEQDPAGTTRLCKIAESLGYRPKHTDFYNSSVALQEGDPAAFLNHGQCRGHLRKTLEQRGMGGEGLVNLKPREAEVDPLEKPVHKLHPRIVERIRKQQLRDNPDLSRKDQNEVRAAIVDQHAT